MYLISFRLTLLGQKASRLSNNFIFVFLVDFIFILHLKINFKDKSICALYFSISGLNLIHIFFSEKRVIVGEDT